jgi:hypothetical protein
MVETLVRMGADINICNADGISVFASLFHNVSVAYTLAVLQSSKYWRNIYKRSYSAKINKDDMWTVRYRVYFDRSLCNLLVRLMCNF